MTYETKWQRYRVQRLYCVTTRPISDLLTYIHTYIHTRSSSTLWLKLISNNSLYRVELFRHKMGELFQKNEMFTHFVEGQFEFFKILTHLVPQRNYPVQNLSRTSLESEVCYKRLKSVIQRCVMQRVIKLSVKSGD
jgi:hypothetical protein